MPSRPPLPQSLRPGDKLGFATVLSVTKAVLPPSVPGAARRKAAADPSQVWGKCVRATTRTVVLEFSVPPKGLSQNGRLNHFAKAKLVKAYRTAAALATADAMREAGLEKPWPRATVQAAFYMPTCKFPDGDNATARLKAIQDGITDGGLWQDDDAAQVTHLPPTFDVDRERPRCVLTLRRKGG